MGHATAPDQCGLAGAKMPVRQKGPVRAARSHDQVGGGAADLAVSVGALFGSKVPRARGNVLSAAQMPFFRLVAGRGSICF
jgi:hypothetical protein